jgi:hypothetical protein
MGSLLEGEFHLIINAIVSKPIHFHFHRLDFLFLFFKKLVERQCPSLVTRCDSVIQKHFMEMRRLTRDDTPFLLFIQPRATTLAW